MGKCKPGVFGATGSEIAGWELTEGSYHTLAESPLDRQLLTLQMKATTKEGSLPLFFWPIPEEKQIRL